MRRIPLAGTNRTVELWSDGSRIYLSIDKPPALRSVTVDWDALNEEAAAKFVETASAKQISAELYRFNVVTEFIQGLEAALNASTQKTNERDHRPNGSPRMRRGRADYKR